MDKKKETVSSVSGSVMQEGVSSSPGAYTYAKIAVIGVLLYIYFKEAVNGVVGKWEDPSWSHGFLIPVFSLYFLNQHKEDILSLRSEHNRFGFSNFLGLLLLAGCLIFHPLNIVQFRIGYFEPLTAIAALGGCVLLVGGWKLVRYTWLPIVYLIFAVPLPERLLFSITMPMRKLAAQSAAVFLSFVNELEATAHGAVIHVIHKGKPLDPPLDVAEACSGMRLLMAFVALGVAMAYLHYRPAWQRLILLASTIPIAIICNIVRVSITGLIFVVGNSKYATGIYHDLLGILMLPLAFGLYWGLAWLMENLFEEEEEAAADSIPDEDVIVRRRDV